MSKLATKSNFGAIPLNNCTPTAGVETVNPSVRGVFLKFSMDAFKAIEAGLFLFTF